MMRSVAPCSSPSHCSPSQNTTKYIALPTAVRGEDCAASFSGRSLSREAQTNRHRPHVSCGAGQNGQAAAPQSFAGIALEKPAGASDEPMQVTFRDVSTWSLWIWVELYEPASGDDLELLEAVLSSWFMLGRLGGFNAMNLQAMYRGNEDTSFMKYDQEQCETALQALFHDMGTLEHKGKWCRCWFNLGTADELALDVLINSLSTLSKENVGIKQLVIGGVNEDWPVAKQQGSV